jgi:predicted nucleotidyltransferase
LLARVATGEGRYLPRVREVWVFGSYARGALEVGDVDLAVKFDQTADERGLWFQRGSLADSTMKVRSGASCAATSGYSSCT